MNYVRSPWILHLPKTESRVAIVSDVRRESFALIAPPKNPPATLITHQSHSPHSSKKDVIFYSAVPFRTRHSESYIIDCFIFDLPLACSVCFMSELQSWHHDWNLLTLAKSWTPTLKPLERLGRNPLWLEFKWIWTFTLGCTLFNVTSWMSAYLPPTSDFCAEIEYLPHY